MTSKKFFLLDGVVYHEDTSQNKTLYVPSSIRDDLIKLSHEKLGHLGADKCYNNMKSKCWFPLMRTKIDELIRNFLKSVNNRILHSIPKVLIPFDTIHIDYLGPWPCINSKRKLSLVVIDSFTKFVKLFSVNSTSTREVIASLSKYFEFCSRPRRIISDRGSSSTSLKFSEYKSGDMCSPIKRTG